MTRSILIATLFWAACASSPPPVVPAPVVGAPPRPEPARDDVAADFHGLYLRPLSPIVDDGAPLGPPPELVRHRCGYGPVCRPSDAWSLEFSRPLLADDIAPSWARVTPSIPDLRVRAGSRWLTLRGTMQADTVYTVQLTDQVRAIDGAALAPVRLQISVGRPAAALWTDAPPIVVQRPGVGSTLAVHTSTEDAPRVARYDVDDADWPTFLALRERLRRTGRLGPIPGAPATDVAGISSRQHILVAQLDGEGSGDPATPPPIAHWVQTSRLGVDVVSGARTMTVWVTDQESGLPVPDATVQLVAHEVVSRGKTGPNGVARLGLAEPTARVALRLVVSHGDDRLMVPDRVRSWDLPSVWQRRAKRPSTLAELVLSSPPPPSRALTADEPWFAGDLGHLVSPPTPAQLAWHLATRGSRWRPPYDARFSFGLSETPDPFARRVVTAATADGVHRLVVGFESVASEQPVTLSVRTDDGALTTEALTTVVHPAARYVGVRASSRVVASGESVSFEVVVVDIAGATRLGAPFSLTVARERWDAERARWTTEPTQVPPRTGLSANHATRCDLGPLPEGRYRATARAVDARGRAHAADTDLWVLGPSALDVPPSDDPTALWLTADQPGYVAGESARLSVVAPFPAGRALVVVDRGDGFDVREAAFTERLLWLTIPIPAASKAPLVVYVMAVGGGRHASGRVALGPSTSDPTGRTIAPTVRIIRTRDRGQFP